MAIIRGQSGTKKKVPKATTTRRASATSGFPLPTRGTPNQTKSPTRQHAGSVTPAGRFNSMSPSQRRAAANKAFPGEFPGNLPLSHPIWTKNFASLTLLTRALGQMKEAPTQKRPLMRQTLGSSVTSGRTKK